ncbi:hypothetical protein ACHAWF_012754 [Thalassiosira exigua]
MILPWLQGRLAGIFLQDISATVDAIGPTIVGFTSKYVGTYSSRSDGAMMMYLAKTPVYIITMTGMWSPIAFLRYIKKQVPEFSKGFRGSSSTPGGTYKAGL